jgi:hypothetical protein
MTAGPASLSRLGREEEQAYEEEGTHRARCPRGSASRNRRLARSSLHSAQRLSPEQHVDTAADRIPAASIRGRDPHARARRAPGVARELYISDTTVKTHITHILQKLDLRGRVQAVVLAYETGLFETDAGSRSNCDERPAR